VVKKTAKRTAARPKAANAGTPGPKDGNAGVGPGLAGPAAVLAQPEIKKIQRMLKSKTADGVSLGLSLLESIGATAADYAAVFTDTVTSSIARHVNKWLEGGEGTKAEYVRYHRLLVEAKAFAARPTFLAAWVSASAKPFIDLVSIPAGSFTMGSPGAGEKYHCHDETEVRVTLTRPFRMSRTVVTQGQWTAVMGTEPWRQQIFQEDQCGRDFPAVHVSWHDAVLFCETLMVLERETGRFNSTQSCRLPTEAEWEYACRAGTTTAYSFGGSPKHLGDHAWYKKNSGNRLHEVAQKQPNSLGLFDMHGNVWEWCADWYADHLMGGLDPVGPVTGFRRVRRGGGWRGAAFECRSGCRYDGGPWPRSSFIGFRVVVEC
jgi:formylglycine-generating enzyme required for sulfatase activity